jgi:hypothetical protein
MKVRLSSVRALPATSLGVKVPHTRDMTVTLYEHLDELYQLFKKYDGQASISDAEWGGLTTSLPVGEGRGANQGNVRVALTYVGLLADHKVTSLWESVNKAGSQGSGRDILVRHVLLNRGGWAFCYVLAVLPGADRQEIWDYYREHFDPDIPDHLVNISQFNNFLIWAGISNKSYRFDARSFERVTDISVSMLGTFGGLPRLSRLAFLALADLDPKVAGTACPTQNLRTRVEATTGQYISPHRLQSVLDPLLDAKFVTYGHAGGGPRARGKKGTVALRRTKAVKALVTSEVRGQLAGTSLEVEVAGILTTNVGELLSKLDDASKDAKGRALEALAVAICWRIGLRNIIIRDRGTSPGVEIDVTAERHLPDVGIISVQCKNHANPVGSPILMKELGIASLIGANSVLIFARNGFQPSAVADARDHAGRFGRNVVLVDGDDLEALRGKSRADEEDAIREIWSREMAINLQARTGRIGTTGWLTLFVAEWLKQRGLEGEDWEIVESKLLNDGLLRIAVDDRGVRAAWEAARLLGK